MRADYTLTCDFAIRTKTTKGARAARKHLSTPPHTTSQNPRPAVDLEPSAHGFDSESLWTVFYLCFAYNVYYSASPTSSGPQSCGTDYAPALASSSFFGFPDNICGVLDASRVLIPSCSPPARSAMLGLVIPLRFKQHRAFPLGLSPSYPTAPPAASRIVAVAGVQCCARLLQSILPAPREPSPTSVALAGGVISFFNSLFGSPTDFPPTARSALLSNQSMPRTSSRSAGARSAARALRLRIFAFSTQMPSCTIALISGAQRSPRLRISTSYELFLGPHDRAHWPRPAHCLIALVGGVHPCARLLIQCLDSGPEADRLLPSSHQDRRPRFFFLIDSVHLLSRAYYYPTVTSRHCAPPAASILRVETAHSAPPTLTISCDLLGRAPQYLSPAIRKPQEPPRSSSCSSAADDGRRRPVPCAPSLLVPRERCACGRRTALVQTLLVSRWSAAMRAAPGYSGLPRVHCALGSATIVLASRWGALLLVNSNSLFRLPVTDPSSPPSSPPLVGAALHPTTLNSLFSMPHDPLLDPATILASRRRAALPVNSNS
ncbi:hypothetical protein B0H10DRAFT_2222741 [Mycena sp. CBHHK59/15]|nr:hypothetical protein B0H10DRAFT_2222737 [Mycena sp. CBHHK59/15]KAJ6612850.1 hypothetical protein B0H10DRAFT_2222741 [Mycena sp. CBHHK59/15]